MSHCFTEIDALDFDLHDGEWKCHIADTDRNITEVRVEAETTLHVAQKSSMFYHLLRLRVKYVIVSQSNDNCLQI